MVGTAPFLPLGVDYDWDWAAAEREYRRAIELYPNYSTGHQWSPQAPLLFS